MSKINPDRLKRTYAVQGRGIYSKEKSQKDIDIWHHEIDSEEDPVINEIAQELYEKEIVSTKVLDFLDDMALSYSAAAAVSTIVKVCGMPVDARHYSERVEDLDRAIEHLERIQARIIHAAEVE
tara:strand:- start:242 stop:613 length:372 start_codon:yes stop_codon:yes gene_type:complete